ncbi:hypothetical protein [Paludibaculum fermentans]|uniref:hypothetical protein n=1 Tax=Paludibaculum fermentans TaxID=1473598 RepID=UPI003EBC5D3E
MEEKANDAETLNNMFLQDAGIGIPEVTERDMAGLILEHLDYEQQLIAISGLLQRNAEADKRVDAAMKELDEYARKSSGWRNERAMEEFGVTFYLSVYQSAAHSMAALGMLAPMYESMFYQAFQGIRTRYFVTAGISSDHHRCKMTDPESFWNCHYHYERKTTVVTENLVSGILQLAKAVGLKKHLPDGLPRMLEALFDYRNFMFHNGFEWPRERCKEFAAHVEQKSWQAWFSNSTRGGEPWIFFMTEEFIIHCFDMIHRLLDGFGAYCRGRVSVETIPVEQVPDE